MRDQQAETKKKKKKSDEFEFCKVCKLNHDQGNRHKYFPNHAKSLSSFLSCFQNKLSDVLFFLKNPTPLRPEHASRNRLWCVFCDSDIHELGSSFSCGNAINHLAGDDHLKNLKSFLWKHGGGMDRVNSFRVSEADLAKWERKCKSLKSEAANEGPYRPLIGPSNDIHNELNSECIDSFDKNTNHFLKSTFSNGVMPLQNYTNERYQVSHSELSEVTEFGPRLHDANSYLPVGTQFNTNPRGLKDLTGYMDNQQSFVCNGGKWPANGYPSNGGMYQGHPDERMVNRESSSQGLQNLTQISCMVQESAKGNVHSGAPPPWFDATEENLLNVRLKPGLGSGNPVSSPNKSGKSQKLNPKRVGAAWAEKRKHELEMEERGEIVTDNFEVNWLPNFGRVWQSGSRKESRKEFEVENKKSLEAETETETETLIKIQPYVSKRMRTDASK
ncbi:TITAN-like protein isoform X1 [Camellia sinensis]|uniref:TITAN-like protein isoform X1 n=1 Tax=Camellia sinensis TaxID=4442 RepID=UPI001035F363|nr:TITAN-like protein isoform X1 [Camellia sinensis]